MARLLQSLYDVKGQVFISPFNITHALLLCSHGVLDQEAAQKFQESLGYSADQAHALFGKKLKVLQQCTNDKEKLFAAASLWFDDPELAKREGFIKQYVDFVSGPYQAEVMPQLSVEKLNQWVDEKTQHLIPSIVNELDPSTRLVLASALYFYAPWKIPFLERWTHPELFTTAEGKETQVPTMRHDESKYFPHYANETLGFQSLAVPYGDGPTSFEALIVLPDNVLATKESWGPILSELSCDSHRYRQQHQHREVNLRLPKFKVTFEASILGELIGLEPPSSPVSKFYTADMLQPDWNLSEVLHKVVVDVNEKGTEAAAVTVMFVKECCMRRTGPPPIEFRVNRPFLFAIYAPQTQDILFMGIVNEIPK